MKTQLLLLLLLGAAPLFALSPEAARLLEQSQTQLAAGDTKAAVQSAEQAAQLAPADAEVQAQLGLAYAQRIGQLNMLQQAMMAGKMRGAFEAALALNPDHLSARIGLARYFTNAPAIAGGSQDRAMAEAGELQKRHPFLGAWELGLIARKFGNPERAIEHYEAAALLQPANAAVQHQLAGLHEQQGRVDHARQHYARVLELEPNDAGARAALARLAEAASP